MEVASCWLYKKGKLLDLAGPHLPCLRNSDENTHCPDRQGLVWGLNEIHLKVLSAESNFISQIFVAMTTAKPKKSQ